MVEPARNQIELLEKLNVEESACFFAANAQLFSGMNEEKIRTVFSKRGII